MKVRRSPQTLQVLREFVRTPRQWRYGYDISRSTGIKSGTLYPILLRLAEGTLLETQWDTSEVGKPPRHMYRLTPGALQFAREMVSSSNMVRMQPAFSGARSR
jgi:PadR family transcriptional regulator, regulatory protein PadR